MTRQFRVEHTDGSTDTLPHVSSEEEYKFGEQDLGVFTTRRSAVNDVTLTEGQDEVYFVEGGADEWGGLLKDVVRKESQTELIVDSFERAARDARPTDGDTEVAIGGQTVVRQSRKADDRYVNAREVTK